MPALKEATVKLGTQTHMEKQSEGTMELPGGVSQLQGREEERSRGIRRLWQVRPGAGWQGMGDNWSNTGSTGCLEFQ